MYRPIEILVADDYEIFRDGFALLIKKNPIFKLVGEASNGKELIKKAMDLKPDVIITDIQMPVMDGVQATTELTRLIPEIGIIALSMFDEGSKIIEMTQAGAKGYLVKNAHKSEIFTAIQAVHKDETYFCKQTSLKLAKMRDRELNKEDEKPSLTDKEITIIQYLCQQYLSKEIAKKLELSVRTVEWHCRIIRQKLHVKNKNGVIVYAITHKIYQPGL